MAGGGAHSKTEKATPKRREEARKKGQVAKSADLNGATVMLAGLFALTVAGGAIGGRLQHAMTDTLERVADPSVVDRHGIGELLMGALTDTALAVAPVAAACLVAGVLASVIQVGFKPSAKAAAPDPKRLNPINGLKQILGPNALVEGTKSIVKVGVVSGIVAIALVPTLPEMGAMVGMTPTQLVGELVSTIMGIAQRATIAYLVIGVADLAWQKHRHEKQLRMDKQEVKEEQKQQQLPVEVRMAIRRRQAAASRARMMAAIAEADVVVAPALAVDTRGARLGQGGGWYDRSLKQARQGVTVVAMVFPEEIYDADERPLPVEDHDMPVHVAVTPERWQGLPA